MLSGLLMMLVWLRSHWRSWILSVPNNCQICQNCQNRQNWKICLKLARLIRTNIYTFFLDGTFELRNYLIGIRLECMNNEWIRCHVLCFFLSTLFGNFYHSCVCKVGRCLSKLEEMAKEKKGSTNENSKILWFTMKMYVTNFTITQQVPHPATNISRELAIEKHLYRAQFVMMEITVCIQKHL